MFTNAHLERYADVLLWGLRTARAGALKRGEIFLVRYNLPAVKLAEKLQARLLEMGMHPVLRSDVTPVMERHFFDLADPEQLVFQTPGDKVLYQILSGSIFLHAPEDITHLSHVDPAKIGQAALARKYIRDILDKREERGLFSWTLCSFPTKALAQHAGLSKKDYTAQIVKACFLNRRAPLDEWRRIFESAAHIKKWLNSLKVRHFHVESKNMDLTITPGDKRRWIGISGHNIPSFELFMSPDWRGTSGLYHADQPSFRSGNLVQNVTMRFKKGRVVEVEARKGRRFIEKQIAMDKGASRIGEFSLTDKRFSKINRFMANTLYDENYGGKYGNCHVALGSSYSDTYAGDTSKLTKKIKAGLGFNDSALHWDLVNTEKKLVTAHLKGGKKTIIYENGVFNY